MKKKFLMLSFFLIFIFSNNIFLFSMKNFNLHDYMKTHPDRVEKHPTKKNIRAIALEDGKVLLTNIDNDFVVVLKKHSYIVDYIKWHNENDFLLTYSETDKDNCFMVVVWNINFYNLKESKIYSFKYYDFSESISIKTEKAYFYYPIFYFTKDYEPKLLLISFGEGNRVCFETFDDVFKDDIKINTKL